MDIQISIVTASKKIGKNTLLSELSFDVFKNETVGLVGENGAGKTSCLKACLNLLLLNSGNIFINSYCVHSEKQKALQLVGFMLDSTYLYRYLTGYENLLLTSRMYQVIDREYINKLVKEADMASYIHNKVSTYSLGMCQRLSFISMLAHKPKILLIDEPLNGLDMEGVYYFRKCIEAFKNQDDYAIIISSHNFVEIENMCDKVIHISRGKKIKQYNLKDNVTKYYSFELTDCKKAASLIPKDVKICLVASKNVTVECTKESFSIILKLFIDNSINILDVKSLPTLESKFKIANMGDNYEETTR